MRSEPNRKLKATQLISSLIADDFRIRDAIINNETGLLVKIRDSEAIYQAIKYMFDNPQIMEKMGKAGRELAENSYNESEVVNLHYAIYSKVTKK